MRKGSELAPMSRKNPVEGDDSPTPAKQAHHEYNQGGSDMMVLDETHSDDTKYFTRSNKRSRAGDQFAGGSADESQKSDAAPLKDLGHNPIRVAQLVKQAE